MLRQLRRARLLALYVLVPLLAAVAPLLVIPAVTARHGVVGWSGVAIGLSVGLVGAVIGELGWNIVGPQEVARRPEAARSCYQRALAARLVVVAPLALGCGVLAASLASSHHLAAGLLAVGVCAGALSPSWYFTGLNRPHLTLLVESLPRTVLVTLAALGISGGGPLELYGAALLAAALLPLLLAAPLVGLPLVPGPTAFRAVGTTLRSQWVLVAGRGVATVYKAMPTPLLAWIAPDLVALYAALDRPLRLGLQFLTALPQRLQAWVAVDDPALRARRSLMAVVMNSVLGVLAGAVYGIAMPLVAPVLFSGTVEVTADLGMLGGVLVAVICASRGFGLALVAGGRAGATSSAAVVSAAIGLTAVPLAAIASGVPGVVLALVASELGGIVVQWAALSLVHRGHRRAEAPA